MTSMTATQTTATMYYEDPENLLPESVVFAVGDGRNDAQIESAAVATYSALLSRGSDFPSRVIRNIYIVVRKGDKILLTLGAGADQQD